MAPGGTAPISTSRVIPPVLAAAKDSTRTPNRSSRCFTPAIAPLSAKTKVPARSSTYGRSCTAGCVLRRHPGPRRNDQGLHPHAQGGVQDGRELRAVVDGKLVEPVGLPG